jgi:hypothetical protein
MSMTLAKPLPLIDANEAGRAISLLLPPGQITELRALDAVLSGDRRTVSVATGYFDDQAELLAALRTIVSAKGIYLIPNPVDDALMARAANRLRPASKGDSTSDDNILARKWFLIDCDPKRPAGIASSEAEHAAALAKLRRVVAYLDSRGWPAPLTADSGNGGHGMYRIELPTDDGGLANFGCQANGAEMLRIACCLAAERGIDICCPIHDALLVEGPDDEIEDVVISTQAAMAEASRAVLGGFELRSEAKIVRWPDRYMDSRGERMWSVVTGILDKLEAEEEAANAQFAM